MAEVERAKMSVVVVAVDGGAHCEHAFNKALKMFPKDRTEFHIVHVRPPKEESLLAPLSPDFTRFSRQLEMRRDRHSKAILDKFQARAEAAGVSFKVVELKTHPHVNPHSGDPREELCKYCAKAEAELLVMGTRGDGPVKRLLLGSVSTHCVQHAPCPVLVDHGLDAAVAVS